VTFDYAASGTYDVAATPAASFFVNNQKTECGPISKCSLLAKDCSAALSAEQSAQLSMGLATPWAVAGKR